MKLWSWYSHSWYPVDGWEIGFDLRRWMLGWFYRESYFTAFAGPIIICYDRSLCPW